MLVVVMHTYSYPKSFRHHCRAAVVHVCPRRLQPKAAHVSVSISSRIIALRSLPAPRSAPLTGRYDTLRCASYSANVSCCRGSVHVSAPCSIVCVIVAQANDTNTQHSSKATLQIPFTALVVRSFVPTHAAARQSVKRSSISVPTGPMVAQRRT